MTVTTHRLKTCHSEALAALRAGGAAASRACVLFPGNYSADTLPLGLGELSGEFPSVSFGMAEQPEPPAPPHQQENTVQPIHSHDEILGSREDR